MLVAIPQFGTVENSSGRADAWEVSGGSNGVTARDGRAPARHTASDLKVAPGVNLAWDALALGLRHRVAALFDRPCALATRSFEVEGAMPEAFARDLAHGGCGFRAAFSAFTRRIEGIVDTTSHTSVRVVCQGKHVGAFFGLLSATGRQVEFEVVHRLVVAGNEVLEDRIALNLRTILLQLAGSPTRQCSGDHNNKASNERESPTPSITSRTARQPMIAFSAGGE
jgi:SnoaL-like polyketide cyclase